MMEIMTQKIKFKKIAQVYQKIRKVVQKKFDLNELEKNYQTLREIIDSHKNNNVVRFF